MSRKARIGIDIDGVLANFNHSFREFIHEHTDVRLPEITDTYPDAWDYHKRAGVMKQDDSKLWKLINDSQTFWKNIPAYSDATLFLEWAAWLPSEVDVYFITSRPGKTAKAQSEAWLQKNGWGYDFHPTVLISSKKGECASALELTHFIDDKNENVLDVYHNGPRSCALVMLARPWNSIVEDVPRIATINEFRKSVEEFIQ